MNRVTEAPIKIEGSGVFTPPHGLTPEECERLAREADAQREEEQR